MLSLARGLEVLNAFAPQRQRDYLAAQPETQISRAAVRRCLYTLAALGMVHNPDGRCYELLPRVLAVGRLPGQDAAGESGPRPRWITSVRSLGESCSAATLDGDNVLYIARAAVNNLLSVDIGHARPSPHGRPQWAACCLAPCRKINLT